MNNNVNNNNNNGYDRAAVEKHLASTEEIISFLKQEGDEGVEKMLQESVEITFDKSLKENLFNKYALLRFIEIKDLALSNDVKATIFQAYLNVEIVQIYNAELEKLQLKLIEALNELNKAIQSADKTIKKIGYI